MKKILDQEINLIGGDYRFFRQGDTISSNREEKPASTGKEALPN